MRPPDPENLEAHLESLRDGLSRCREDARKATEDRERRIYAQRLRSYRREIRDLEHDLEKLKAGDLEGTRWERRPMDELTWRALAYQAAQMEGAPDGEAHVHQTPGLPLLIPNVPEGLPAKERERIEADQWRAIYGRWARTIADSMYLKGSPQRGLMELARREGADPADLKLLYALAGLLEALCSAGEPWRGKIGDGKGSGKVPHEGGEIVPASAGVVGQLKWLAQEGARRAKLILAGYADDSPGLTSPEEETWPVDPETGDLLPPEAVHSDAVDPALVAEEQNDDLVMVADAMLLASDQQRRISLALADPDLGDRLDEITNSPLTPEERDLLALDCESWADVGRALDLPAGQVRSQAKRLREKLED